MTPPEIASVCKFITDTLLTHKTVSVKNASQSTLNRGLVVDELTDLIIRFSTDKRYKTLEVEEFGYVVYKNPNYEVEVKQESKLFYETRLAKWTYYTYWAAFIFSIAGLIISIIALLKKG